MGHVTSITRRLDSPYATSIGNEPLSPTIFEIYGHNTLRNTLMNEQQHAQQQTQQIAISPGIL